MFFRILKKDLKRNKTMNIILLSFIVLASVFISSSVGNILSVFTALEDYTAKSEVMDCTSIINKVDDTEEKLTYFLDNEAVVTDYQVNNILTAKKTNVQYENTDLDYDNPIALCPISAVGYHLFLPDGNTLEQVNDGEVYLMTGFANSLKIRTGDTLNFSIGDTTMKLRVAGTVKDIIFGSTLMGMTRIIMSENDFTRLDSDPAAEHALYMGANFTDKEIFDSDFAKQNFSIFLFGYKEIVFSIYIIDMVIAGMILIVSLCLILISLVILRFTIVFTLTTDFREIGIMKAIGVPEKGIRLLYCIKYFALAVIGAIIGLLAGIPFGKLLLSMIQKNILMTKHNGFLSNFLCVLAVIAIITFFCFFTTGKLKRFTPIDAIRGGEKGERFQRKGVLSLAKHRHNSVSYLVWNDILTGPKRFAVLLLVFTLGVLLLTIPINVSSTLSSDELVTWFDFQKSDLYLSGETLMTYATSGPIARQDLIDEMDRMEHLLAENHIPAKLSVELLLQCGLSVNKERNISVITMQGVQTDADHYSYIEGTAPSSVHEIAMSHMTAEKAGVNIGDTVSVIINGQSEEFLVTALFQSMINMGEGIRLHEDYPTPTDAILAKQPYQITYTDNPVTSEKEKRREQIEDLFPDRLLYNGGAFMKKSIGIDLDNLVLLFLLIALCINSLVAVLIARTMIAGEKGEIGMMKAIGFNHHDIVSWQTARLGVVMLIASLFAGILSKPITKITTSWIFKLMGAADIDLFIQPIRTYVLCPLSILIVTLVSVLITANSVKKISAAESSNVE